MIHLIHCGGTHTFNETTSALISMGGRNSALGKIAGGGKGTPGSLGSLVCVLGGKSAVSPTMSRIFPHCNCMEVQYFTSYAQSHALSTDSLLPVIFKNCIAKQQQPAGAPTAQQQGKRGEKLSEDSLCYSFWVSFGFTVFRSAALQIQNYTDQIDPHVIHPPPPLHSYMNEALCK